MAMAWDHGQGGVQGAAGSHAALEAPMSTWALTLPAVVHPPILWDGGRQEPVPTRGGLDRSLQPPDEFFIPVAPAAPAVPSFSTTTRAIRRMRRSPHLVTEKLWQFFHTFEVHLQTGMGLTTGQGVDPQIMLRVSFDGGQTWGDEQWTTAGAMGAYWTRAEFRRLGRGRDAVFEISTSDPNFWAIIDAFLDAEGGIS